MKTTETMKTTRTHLFALLALGLAPTFANAAVLEYVSGDWDSTAVSWTNAGNPAARTAENL